jgi:hypothetical protein
MIHLCMLVRCVHIPRSMLVDTQSEKLHSTDKMQSVPRQTASQTGGTAPTSTTYSWTTYNSVQHQVGNRDDHRDLLLVKTTEHGRARVVLPRYVSHLLERKQQ